MYSTARLAIKYIRYFISAINGKGHGVHSPFVFDFIKFVKNNYRHYEAYKQVEQLRKQLQNDKQLLLVSDFGAGSVKGNSKQKTIAAIATSAAKPKKYAQLLYRIVQYYKPKHIIELGTSLGISAAYMAMADTTANIITLEGAGEIANAAKQNFIKLGIKNIELIIGNFDNTLQTALKKMPVIDLAFIDGNHRMQPTLHYFEQLFLHSNEQSIFIFDDIHWSAEMEQAWQHIQQHHAVTLTLDFFFIGIVFFRKDFKVKQHFTIRY
jgi:predicted O-methyltransferase YrrM